MHQGVLTSANFGEIFRGISQRRKQGVLEVAQPDRALKIFFATGKIVEVIDGTVSPLLELTETLKAAQAIPGSFKLDSEETYQDLFSTLSLLPFNGFPFDEKVFRRVAKHRVLDKLYGLDLRIGAFYSFHIEMVEIDKDFSPAISVGQLLLDLVALDSDKAQFDATFPAPSAIRHSSAEPESLCEEEEVIYNFCAAPINLEDLRRRSVLSSFHFLDSLMSLHKRGYIEVTGAIAANLGTGSQSGLSESDLFDSLDALGDQFTKDLGSTADLGSGATIEESQELEEEGADEAEEAVPLRIRLTALSIELTNVPWIPHLIVWCFVALAILGPLVFWSDLLNEYKHS